MRKIPMKIAGVNGPLKTRLHRRFLLRSFSFWCMRLNGLTYECIRPSVQSYINRYFCDSTAQSHASEWEKSPQKSPRAFANNSARVGVQYISRFRSLTLGSHVGYLGCLCLPSRAVDNLSTFIYLIRHITAHRSTLVIVSQWLSSRRHEAHTMWQGLQIPETCWRLRKWPRDGMKNGLQAEGDHRVTTKLAANVLSHILSRLLITLDNWLRNPIAAKGIYILELFPLTTEETRWWKCWCD